MNARLLLTTILLVVSAAAVMAVGRCDPDCNGHVAHDKVPDPMNCTRYYICVSDGVASEKPVSCTSGNHFDPSVNDCVPGTDCDSTCAGGTNCDMSCSSTGDLIADPKNCSIYYICDASNHIGATFVCPPSTPYFGGDHCTNDPSMCCQPTCTAYCGPDDVQIIDPNDCNKFFICVGEGPADEANHGSCDENENFNVVSSTCETNVACLILCDDSTTTITTTTTVTPSSCESSYTCPGSGFYPTSQTCQAEYYSCSGSGECGELAACTGGQVFNPVPGYPWCVLPSNCPYSPSVYSLYYESWREMLLP